MLVVILFILMVNVIWYIAIVRETIYERVENIMEELTYIHGYIQLKDGPNECVIITSKNTGLVTEIILIKQI